MPARTRVSSSRRVIWQTLAVQGVEVNIQAAQASVEQRFRVAGQQYGIRRKGKIADTFQPGQFFNERRQLGTQQRLASGEPNLVSPSGTAADTKRRICSKLSCERSGAYSAPVSGMQ